MERRTTIFSIFVLLCLLPNSTYARTTEYENPRDTILDMMLYFDLKVRQAEKDYQGNGKTLATLDSLLAHPAHSRHLYSIILLSPDSYNGKKEQDVTPGLRRSKSVLMSEISASQCRPNLYPYRRRVRGCLTETDNGRQAGPRPGGCIGIDRLSP